MTSSPTLSARFQLRDATAAMHERVDALFSGVDLADRAQYARFLTAQATAHLAVEQALERDGVGAVVPDWPSRRRGDLVRQDLADLGEAVPTTDDTLRFATTSSQLGALYVLEGSRLGGAILKDEVGAGLPKAYLSGQSSSAWRSLVALLDEHLVTRRDMDEAAASARDVFSLFEQSATWLLPSKGVAL